MNPIDDREVRPDPPYLPESMSYTDRIRAWMEVEDASIAMLRAGLREEVGPDGDLEAAFRAWYDRYADEHHKGLEQMCEEFNRRWKAHV
jgi:hypothetical protein